MGHFFTALLATKMLEVPTASGRSEPGLSWQSEVGDDILIDAVVNRSGKIVKSRLPRHVSFRKTKTP
jgi:hypothetical protein